MAGPAIFGLMIWVFYLRFIVPVLGVFYGTSLIADEVEDKTITYLFTRPIPRGAVLLGKYLAYLVCTVFVVLPSVMLVYLLDRADARAAWAASFLDLRQGPGAAGAGPGGLRRACSPSSAPGSSGRCSSASIFVFGWEQAALAFPGLPQEVHGRLLPAGAGAARDAERQGS